MHIYPTNAKTAGGTAVFVVLPSQGLFTLQFDNSTTSLNCNTCGGIFGGILTKL